MPVPEPSHKTAVIEQPGGAPAVAEVGMRVARWHETFPGQFDPIPGTIARIGRRFLTVDFDDHGERRVEPRNVTPWSEPRDNETRATA